MRSSFGMISEPWMCLRPESRWPFYPALRGPFLYSLSLPISLRCKELNWKMHSAHPTDRVVRPTRNFSSTANDGPGPLSQRTYPSIAFEYDQTYNTLHQWGIWSHFVNTIMLLSREHGGQVACLKSLRSKGMIALNSAASGKLDNLSPRPSESEPQNDLQLSGGVTDVNQTLLDSPP